MNGKFLAVVMCLALATVLVFTPFPAVATGGGGGGHCDHEDHDDDDDGCCCGGEIKVKFYFDANQNGRYNGSVDGWMDGLVSIYEEGWAYMATHAVGRDDGIPNNGGDRGRTTFRGLRPDNEGYIVCAHGPEVFFTQPTASTPDPSNRVHIVERLSVNTDESRYCYRVEIRNNCSDETIWFGVYSNVE
ncbi:MAG: hypothetical protein KBD16_04195 [Candidatus Pacebacteria bacterium]|nr:hypothetical protein [Candidatus Paceibacterota bacterium]